MAKSLLVSILIPAYNVGEYLTKCLNSLKNQTYSNLQIVVIDDGSKDNTWDICQQFADKDVRFEIIHQENCGVATTRNRLLKCIRGEYVLFVDADDWIEPDMVKFMVDKLSSNNHDIVSCGSVVNDNPASPSLITEELWSQEKYVYEFLRHVLVNGSLWNKLIRTDLLANETFRRDVTYGEDALFIWHIIQKVKGVFVTNKPLYHHRIDNQGSLSHQNWHPDKKGTGSIVWRTITEDTRTNWPQYLDVAKARYAVEDMWCLYHASLANYPYDEHIKERQLNVRQNLGLIRRSGLVSFNKIIACYALAYCYSLGRFIKYTR